jgi:hypothetical protein
MSNTLAEIRKAVVDCLTRLDELMDLAVIQDLASDELAVAVKSLLAAGVWNEKNKLTYDNAGNKNKALKSMLSEAGEEVVSSALAEYREHKDDGALVKSTPAPAPEKPKRRKPGRPRKDADAKNHGPETSRQHRKREHASSYARGGTYADCVGSLDG